MMWFLKTFWRSLLLSATLIGLIFLASDLGDVPEAIEDWRRVFAVIDVNTALWIFSLTALAYIIWIDARPLYERWRKGDRLPVSVADTPAWRSLAFEVEGESFYKNVCYILVFNNSRRKRTAHDVRVRTYTLGEPQAAVARNGGTSVDIHHGEVEWFEIGSIISKSSYGFVRSSLEISDQEKAASVINAKNGYYVFHVSDKQGIGLGHKAVSPENILDNPLSFLMARVSAVDTPTIEIKFRLISDLLERDGAEILSPIEISEIRSL